MNRRLIDYLRQVMAQQQQPSSRAALTGLGMMDQNQGSHSVPYSDVVQPEEAGGLKASILRALQERLGQPELDPTGQPYPERSGSELDLGLGLDLGWVDKLGQAQSPGMAPGMPPHYNKIRW